MIFTFKPISLNVFLILASLWKSTFFCSCSVYCIWEIITIRMSFSRESYCVWRGVLLYMHIKNQALIDLRNKIEPADGEKFPKTLEGLPIFCDCVVFALALLMGSTHHSHLWNKRRFSHNYLLDAKPKWMAVCCTILDKCAHSVNRASNYIPHCVCGGFWFQ